MALFNFGKKKKPEPVQNEKPTTKLIWSKEFTQSGTFRGYRRIKLGRYYHDIVDASLSDLKKSRYDMKGRTIRLDNIASTDKYNKYKVVQVYVDDKLVGNVFDSDEKQYSMLTDYEYDKVHIRVEDTALDVDFDTSNVVTTKVYLFVHYPNEAPVKVETSIK